MQENKSIMVMSCELKFSSLGVMVWHYLASLVMPNSYPCYGMFNSHLTTFKESYILNSYLY